MRNNFTTTKLLTATAMTTALAVPAAFAGSSFAPTPLPQGIVHAAVGFQAAQANQAQANQAQANQAKANQLQTVSGNTLMGIAVQSKQGEQLGKIVDVVVNSQNGDIQYLVMSDNGGTLGSGSEMYAVPWSEFTLSDKKQGNKDKQESRESQQSPEAQDSREAQDSERTPSFRDRETQNANQQTQHSNKMQSKVLTLDTSREKLNQAKTLESSGWPTSVDAASWDQADQNRQTNRSNLEREGGDSPDVRNDRIQPQDEDGQIDSERPNRERDLNRDRNRNQDGINSDRNNSDGINSDGNSSERKTVDPPSVRNDRIQPATTPDDDDASDNADNLDRSARDRNQRDRTAAPGDRDENTRPNTRQTNRGQANAQGDNARTSWNGNATKDNQFAQKGGTNQSSQVSRLSDLIGMQVQGENDTPLGELEDVVIDTEHEKIVYAQIGFGGSAFAEQDTVYVPFEMLKSNSADDQFTVSLSEEKLMELEQGQDNNPDITSESFGEQLYTSLDSEPYWNQDKKDKSKDAATDNQSEPMTQQQRDQRTEQSRKAWKSGSDYNKTYDTDEVRDIKGTVTSIGSHRPTAGAESGLRFRVMAEDGNSYVIHAGPRSYTQQQGFSPSYGDQVEIVGSAVQCEGRDVVIAREVTMQDNTVTLRNEQGEPQWDQQ